VPSNNGWVAEGVIVGVDVGIAVGVAVCVTGNSGVSVALGTSVISGINVGSEAGVSGVLGVAPEHAASPVIRRTIIILRSFLFNVSKVTSVIPAVWQ